MRIRYRSEDQLHTHMGEKSTMAHMKKQGEQSSRRRCGKTASPLASDTGSPIIGCISNLVIEEMEYSKNLNSRGAYENYGKSIENS